MDISSHVTIDFASWADVIRFWTARKRDQIALIFGSEEYTWEELDDLSNKLANALVAMGIKKGDKVAVLIHNVPEFIVAYYAIAKVGAVNVPLSVRFKSDDLVYGISNADCVALILAANFVEEFELVREQVNLPAGIILVERTLDGKKLRLEDVLSQETVKNVTGGRTEVIEQHYKPFYGYIVENYSAADPLIPVSREDDCLIWYTSGTTGRPKGALHTHGQVLIGAEDAITCMGLSKSTRSIVTAPCFHNIFNGIVGAPMAVGGTVILMLEFKTVPFLEEVTRTKPNFFAGVPAMYILLLDHPDLGKYNISSLTTLAYGAAPMPPEVITRLYGVVGEDVRLHNVLGQSENGPTIAIGDSAYALTKAAAIGRPTPNNEIKIMDDNDNSLPTEEVGEICIRGGGVMKGYYKMPEATEETLRNGWLHTGDLGYFDQDGFLYLIDRKKEIIIRGGENIYPKEIEDILYTHPKILHAAVIGVPDRVLGEVVKIFVVPKQESKNDLGLEEVVEFCKEHMAEYKVPKYVEVVPDLPLLPLNATGKIDKILLRQQERQKYLEQTE